MAGINHVTGDTWYSWAKRDCPMKDRKIDNKNKIASINFIRISRRVKY